MKTNAAECYNAELRSISRAGNKRKTFETLTRSLQLATRSLQIHFWQIFSIIVCEVSCKEDFPNNRTRSFALTPIKNLEKRPVGNSGFSSQILLSIKQHLQIIDWSRGKTQNILNFATNNKNKTHKNLFLGFSRWNFSTNSHENMLRNFRISVPRTNLWISSFHLFTSVCSALIRSILETQII